MERFLTDEQNLEIIEKYLTGNYSFKSLGKEYNRTPPTIKQILKKYNIPVRPVRKFTINHQYFDSLDEQKAYWLGFLYSDGCVYRNTLHLGLQERDSEILEQLSVDIGSDKPLIFEKREVGQNMKIFHISSPSIVSKLIELGCPPAKSLILKFPTEDQVPKHLLRHWLRGMWDGDGCVTLSDTKRLSMVCSLMSTVDVCIQIKELILNELGITSSVRQPNPDNKRTAIISINSCRSGCILFNWLYSDCDRYLKRKHDKFQKIKSILKNKMINNHQLLRSIKDILC